MFELFLYQQKEEIIIASKLADKNYIYKNAYKLGMTCNLILINNFNIPRSVDPKLV